MYEENSSDESCTSGSSFQPSDEDADSSDENATLFTNSKDSGKVKNNQQDQWKRILKSKSQKPLRKEQQVTDSFLDPVKSANHTEGFIISKEDIYVHNFGPAMKTKKKQKGGSKRAKSTFVTKKKSPSKKKVIKQAPLKSGHNYDRDTIAKACERMRKGETISAVATSIGANFHTLSRWKRKYVLHDKPVPADIGEIKRRHDKNVRIKVLERLKQGESTLALAKELDIDERTVKTWHTRYLAGEKSDLKVSRKGENYSRETIIEACKRLEEGVSATALALELGAGVGTVARWRDRYVVKGEPVPTSFRKYRGDNVKLEALKRLKQGESMKSVAFDLNTHVSTLQIWQKKYVENEESELKLSVGQNYNKEFISKACNRLKQGESAKDLAKELGVRLKTVQQWQNKHIIDGEVVMKIPRFFDTEKKVKACNQLLQGESVEKIALECNVTPETVRNWRKKYIVNGKVSVESKRDFDKDVIFDALKRYKEGVSSKVIAKEIGVHQGTIANWQRKYGKKEPKTVKSEDNLNQSKIIESCNRLKQGESVKHIAKKLRVTFETVQEWQNKYTVDEQVLTEVPRSFDKEIRRKVCNRLLQGKKIAAVAREFGVHPDTVFYWKKRYIKGGKVNVESKRLFDKDTIYRALKQLRQGLSTSAVAKEIGVLPGAIRVWRRRYGGKKIKSSKEVVTPPGYKIIEACNRLQKGDSVAKVAIALDVDITRVQKWRREYLQISEIKGGKKYDEKIILDACERMKQGVPLVTLAEELGVEQNTLGRWRREHVINEKYVSKHGSHYDKRMILETCNRLNQGESPEAVSDHFGIDIRDVLNWQREYCTRKDDENNSEISKSTVLKDVKLKNKESFVRNTFGSLSRSFVPLRKVCMPRKMKLQVVKMHEKGVSIAELSRKLNINGLTIKSWILNKDLLMGKV